MRPIAFLIITFFPVTYCITD